MSQPSTNSAPNAAQRPERERVLRKTAAAYTARLVCAAASLFVLALLARALPLVELGAYLGALSVQGILMGPLRLGSDDVLIDTARRTGTLREFYRTSQRVLHPILGLNLLAAAAVVVAAPTIAAVALGGSGTSAIQVFGIGLLVCNPLLITGEFLKGRGAPSLAYLIPLGLPALLQIIAVLVLPELTPYVMSLAVLASQAVGLAVSLCVARTLGHRQHDLAPEPRERRVSPWLVGAELSESALVHGCTLIVGALSGPAGLAIVRIFYRTSNLIALLGVAAHGVLAPLVGVHDKTASAMRMSLSRANTSLIVLTGIGSVALFFVGRLIFPYLRPELLAHNEVFFLSLIASACLASALPARAFLTMRGRYREYGTASIALACVFVAVAPLAEHRWPLHGAMAALAGVLALRATAWNSLARRSLKERPLG